MRPLTSITTAVVVALATITCGKASAPTIPTNATVLAGFALDQSSVAAGGQAQGTVAIAAATVDDTSISLTSAATTNIIDVSVEAGLWMTFGCSVSAAVSGTPVVHLKWTVDGEAEQSQTLYNSSAAFVAEIRAASWNVGGDSVGVDGGGNQAFDNLVLGFYTPYATSLKVDVQVASTGTGTIVCAALRATELP